MVVDMVVDGVVKHVVAVVVAVMQLENVGVVLVAFAISNHSGGKGSLISIHFCTSLSLGLIVLVPFEVTTAYMDSSTVLCSKITSSV